MNPGEQLARMLKGKRIAQVKLHKFRTGRKDQPWTCDPEIIFIDGSKLHFVVVETEVGEYGIDPVFVAPAWQQEQQS